MSTKLWLAFLPRSKACGIPARVMLNVEGCEHFRKPSAREWNNAVHASYAFGDILIRAFDVFAHG